MSIGKRGSILPLFGVIAIIDCDCDVLCLCFACSCVCVCLHSLCCFCDVPQLNARWHLHESCFLQGCNEVAGNLKGRVLEIPCLAGVPVKNRCESQMEPSSLRLTGQLASGE